MRKLAVCIGNNDYKYIGKLKYAVSDAEAMKDKLSTLDFETQLYTNLDRNSMIDSIISNIEKLGSYDAFLLYFSGHGFEVGGKNLLMPIDINLNNRNEIIEADSCALNKIFEKLYEFPDITKIIILDACRQVLGQRGDKYNGFAPVLAPKGTIIAFSTSHNQSAYEDDDIKHGRYTNSLLKYISTARKPIESIFKNVRQELVSKYDGQQVPWEHTSLVGDFYINPDNIYNNFSYQEFAYRDSMYDSSKNEPIDIVIDKLKTTNWYVQKEGIKQIVKLDFENESASKLFVLGRNIYQAACGECFEAIEFINSFGESIINIQAKTHILNGMAYEIYFNSKGNIRDVFKTKKYYPIICLLEKQEFYSCQNFIVSKVSLISSNQYIYMPGSGKIYTLEIIINSKDNNLLEYILLDGVIIYNSDEYDDSCKYDVTYCKLVEMIYKKLVIPHTNIVVLSNIESIKDDDYIHIPLDFKFKKT